MVYQIKPYSYEQAKKLNVEIRPSTRKDKKIDVYKDKKFICSIGCLLYTSIFLSFLVDGRISTFNNFAFS